MTDFAVGWVTGSGRKDRKLIFASRLEFCPNLVVGQYELASGVDPVFAFGGRG